LRAGVQAERPRAPALIRRLDHKREAIGSNHRPPEALQEPKRNQGKEIRREAAKNACRREHDEAHDVEQLSAKDPTELTEDRHERRATQEISQRDPAYALQAGVEYATQGWQRELDNARVDLAHEPGD
jgi:hypothetical protein